MRNWVRKYLMNYGKGHSKGYIALLFALDTASFNANSWADWTKARLSQIYKDANPNCVRCNQSPANHVHMFWCCPSLVGFWKDIFNTLSELSGTEIEPDPFTALFGVSLPTTQLTN